MTRLIQFTRSLRSLYLLLFLSVMLCLVLLAARIFLTETTSYIFLAWNLFLAWIPLFMAWIGRMQAKRGASVYQLVPVLLLWLLFFPNAPYIITDILHFRHRPEIAGWYDVSMLMAFSWTGLIMGIVSLIKIELIVKGLFGKVQAVLFVFVSLLLAGLGVYIGRFLRWNSWDILRDPFALMRDILIRILNPELHIRTYAVTGVFAAFLLLAYYTVKHVSVLTKPE